MANQIILNKISGTARIFDVVAPAGTTNGNVLVLGTQNADKTYAGAANSAVTDKGMVMVLNVNLPYGVDVTEDGYTIATSEVVRCYTMELGFVVSIPQANITATAALGVGKVVVPKAGVAKMECLASAVGTESLIFVIDELFTKAGVSMAKLRVIKED